MKLRHLVKIDFPYTPAVKTDIAKTIAKEKKRLAEVERSKVIPIRQRAAK